MHEAAAKVKGTLDVIGGITNAVSAEYGGWVDMMPYRRAAPLPRPPRPLVEVPEFHRHVLSEKPFGRQCSTCGRLALNDGTAARLMRTPCTGHPVAALDWDSDDVEYWAFRLMLKTLLAHEQAGTSARETLQALHSRCTALRPAQLGGGVIRRPRLLMSHSASRSGLQSGVG